MNLKCPNPYSGLKTPEGINQCYWFEMLWNRAMSLYEWKGKPFEGIDATLNRDYLEWSLMSEGYACFIKDKEGKLRGLKCAPIGLDPYSFPVDLLATNPVLGNLSGRVNKDCVWIRNNIAAKPVKRIICYYATQLAKVQTSLNVSLSNNRMANVFSAENDEQAQAIRKMVDDIDSGKLGVIQKPDIFSQIMGGANGNNGMLVYSTASQYLADKYIENIREILNDFYITFGVNSSGANMIKHDKNTVAEVNSNNQQIMINRVYWLQTRKEAAEKASELFGVDISVDLRDDNVTLISREELGYHDEFSDKQYANEPSVNTPAD